MLQYFVIGISICLSVAADPAGEDLVPEDKGQCVNKLIQWCSGIEYPQGGRSVVWLSHEDPSGHFRVLCFTDSDGSNCTKNGIPWLSCSSDHHFFYNGNQQTENSTDGVDDDICKIADKVCNGHLGQNLSYNNAALKPDLQKELECFFDQIASMKAQMEALQERMRIYLTFVNGFNNSSVTDSISSYSTTVTPGTSVQGN